MENYIYIKNEFIEENNFILNQFDKLTIDYNGKYEYTNGILKFKGEYLNGKRNGKGKEYYDNGKLKFEGEYLYNHRLKGKEFSKNGELRFEGEYLNDKKWNGKEYDKNSNIIYELINGNGIIEDNDYYNKINIFFEKNSKEKEEKNIVIMVN